LTQTANWLFTYSKQQLITQETPPMKKGIMHRKWQR